MQKLGNDIHFRALWLSGLQRLSKQEEAETPVNEYERGEMPVFRAEDYVKVRDLEEAYELCQKRSSLVVGGMVWMKMTSLTKRVIVDLSGLGLDQIEENQEEFRIGCMCSLRQMEIHSGLNDYFNGIFKECTRHIVGVQMRNCATVGGSIYGRFGFSDILTCMLALDSYVELYKEGIISLQEFAARPVGTKDRDILVRIIIRKDGRKAADDSQRATRTDFPIIACCVSRLGNYWDISVGARPAKAKVIRMLDDGHHSFQQLSEEAVSQFGFGTNLRGSKEYRRALAVVYVRRLMERLAGRSVGK